MGPTIQISRAEFERAISLIRANEVAQGCQVLLEHLQQPVSGEERILGEIARLLSESGFKEESIKILRFAYENDSDDVQILAALVDALVRESQWFELIPLAEKLRGKYPEDSGCYSVLAMAYFIAGDLEKCREIISLGLERATHGVNFQPGRALRLEGAPRISVIMACRQRANARIDRLRASYDRPSLFTWRPDLVGDTTARLNGATINLPETAEPFFELASEGKETIRVAATLRSNGAAADAGVTVWQANAKDLVPGRTYEVLLRVEGTDAVDCGGPTTLALGKHGPPAIGDTAAVWAGNDGAILSGTVGGSTLATTYHFAYGHARKRLDKRTTSKMVPPGRTNRVWQQVVEAPNDWPLIYPLEYEIIGNDGDPESPDAFAVRLKGPFGKDRNHMNGVGIGDLVAGWDGQSFSSADAGGARRANSRDLRDAVVALVVRPKRLDAKDFLFACGTQSGTGRHSTASMEDTSTWSLTGQLVDPRGLNEDKWNRLEFVFRNDPRSWTFCGNCPDEQGNAARYAYLPIDEVLSQNRGNIFFWFILGDQQDPPVGDLDLRSIGLRFRDWSILAPHAGTELVAFPDDALSDPLCLTSGWFNNVDEMWLSAPNPKSPQTFIWRLPTEASPTVVRLRQNVLRPARTVEISTSADGRDFRSEWVGDLPKASSPVDSPPPTAVSLEGRSVKELKLVIRSGYQDDFWGLDAIEAFDDAATPVPEMEDASVCEEIADLKPGKKLYFRLIAENAAGRTRGPACEIVVPATQKPAITDGKLLRQTDDRATLFVEVMPGGLDTELTTRLTDPDGNSRTGKPKYVGRNRSVRHAIYSLECPRRAGSYRAEIIASNEAGKSAAFGVSWDVAGPDQGGA